MNIEKLKEELKEMIVNECNKDVNPKDIKDDENIFGPNSILELDSLDALQISIEVNKRYNIKITDSKVLKKVMISIEKFADFLSKQ